MKAEIKQRNENGNIWLSFSDKKTDSLKIALEISSFRNGSKRSGRRCLKNSSTMQTKIRATL